MIAVQHLEKLGQWLKVLVLVIVSSCCEMKCCAKKCKGPGKMSVKTEPFGKTTDGQQVDIVILTNGKGLTAQKFPLTAERRAG